MILEGENDEVVVEEVKVEEVVEAPAEAEVVAE